MYTSDQCFLPNDLKNTLVYLKISNLSKNIGFPILELKGKRYPFDF
jgi:hypothetical protein